MSMPHTCEITPSVPCMRCAVDARYDAVLTAVAPLVLDTPRCRVCGDKAAYTWSSPTSRQEGQKPLSYCGSHDPKCDPSLVRTDLDSFEIEFVEPEMFGSVVLSRCPICSAYEVGEPSPFTRYACGSYDHDQRPGTFRPSSACVLTANTQARVRASATPSTSELLAHCVDEGREAATELSQSPAQLLEVCDAFGVLLRILDSAFPDAAIDAVDAWHAKMAARDRTPSDLQIAIFRALTTHKESELNAAAKVVV